MKARLAAPATGSPAPRASGSAPVSRLAPVIEDRATRERVADTTGPGRPSLRRAAHVQLKFSTGRAQGGPASHPARAHGSGRGAAAVHAFAARGAATSWSALPHGDAIQRAFVRPDLSSVQAHTGRDAVASARAMGAEADAAGNHVVLGDEATDQAAPVHVQKAHGAPGVHDPQVVHAAAARGIATSSTQLPYAGTIQRLFGRHDVSSIQAHAGSEAAASARAMNAEAYATGDHVAFAGTPSLHTAAHEAAHIIQQRGGVQLKGGVGQAGDVYEKHADEVADLVVQGKSVEAVLDRHAGSGSSHAPAAAHAVPTGSVQRMLVGVEMETVVPVYQHGTRSDHVDGYAAQGGGYEHQNIDSVLSAQLGSGFEIHIDDSKTARRQALDLLNPGAKLQIAELIAPPANNRARLLDNLQRARRFLDFFTGNRERHGGMYSMGWPTPTSEWQPPRPADPSSAQTPVVAQATMEAAFKADHDGSQGQLYRAASQVTFQGGPASLKTISDADTWDYQVANPAFGHTKNVAPRGPRVPRTLKQQAALVDRSRMASALGVELDREPGDVTARAIDVAVKIFQDTLRLLTQSYAGTVKNAVSYMIRSDLGKMFQDVEPSERHELATKLVDSISRLEVAKLEIPPQIADKILTRDRKFIKVDPITYKLLTNPLPMEEGELEHIDVGLQNAVAFRSDQEKLRWQVFTEWLATQVGEAVGGAAHATPSGVTGPLHGMRNLGLLQEDGATKETAQPGVVFEDRLPIDLDLAQTSSELPAAITDRLKAVDFP